MEFFTQAIVLSKSDVKEYDRFFRFYTKHLGKTTVLAKGVRRGRSKMAGHLEPFGLLAIKIVSGRGTNKLSNVETQKRYQNIIKDLELIKLGRQCLNLVDELVKEGSCDLGVLRLLNQILEILDQLNKNLIEKKFLVNVFNLRLLAHLGYRPELYQCVVCKKKIEPAGNKFDFLKGGLVCSQCQSSGVDISEKGIKVLRLILEKELNFFTDNKINERLGAEVGKIIDRFVQVVREN